MNYEIKCEQCGSKVSSSIEMIGYQTQCSTCGAEFTIPLTNFTAGMVSGNYWLQKSIGNGNISQTFVAKRMDDNEKVFLKILSPCVTLVHEDVEQFMIEMCRSHQIDHPNLLSVYETGKMNGHYYLATRFVDGECLDKRIARTGPLSEKEALRLCLKIARILRSCWHDYGIVHRSIKPQNILVNDAGEVFLLDVGNCKQLLISESIPLERMDNLGTLGDYMSPEEAQGVVDVDCSSDIYSLGATLFFLMTGTKPYVGSDTTQVLLKHLNEPTPSITQRSGEVTRPTAKFIRSMMDSDPENRIYSWREVVARLKKLLKGKTLGTGPDRVLKTQASTSTDFADEVRNSVETENREIPKPFPVITVAIIAMVAIILLGAIAVGVMLANRSKPDSGGAVVTPDNSKGNDKGAKSGSGTRRIADTTFEAQLTGVRRLGSGRAQRQVTILKRMLAQTEDPAQIEAIKSVLAQVQKGEDVTPPMPKDPPKPTPTPKDPPKDSTPKPASGPKVIRIDKCELKLNNRGNNSLRNGDFEELDTKAKAIKYWKKDGSGKLNVVGSLPISGKLAVELSPGAGLIQRTGSVNGVAGQTVTVSIWAMARGGATGTLEIRFIDKDGKVASMATTKVGGRRDYEKYTANGKAPKDCDKLEILIKL